MTTSKTKEVRPAGTQKPRAVTKRFFKWLWKHRDDVFNIILWLITILVKMTGGD